MNIMEQPKRHRKSGINFEELLNKEWSVLTKAEYSEFQTSYKRTEQRNGGISFYDLINIIRSNCLFTQAWAFLFQMSARIRLIKTSLTSRFEF